MKKPPASDGRSLRKLPPASSAQSKKAPFCTLAIKATPNAPRSEILGWLGDTLKVKVHAPPVEGRANEVLCAFLADTFGLPRRAVSVLRGDTSRLKLVRLDGVGLENVREHVATLLNQT